MVNFYSPSRFKTALKAALCFVMLGGAAAAQTVLLNEDFSTATGTTPPSGWANNTISGASYDVWRFNNPGGRTANSPMSAPFGIFDSDNNSNDGIAENAALESAAFSSLGYGHIVVSWDQYYRHLAPSSGNLEVWGGSTWISVYSVTSTTSNPNHQNIDISAYAANRTGVKVRFRYSGNWSWWWIIDNISITGNKIPQFTAGSTQSLSVCQDVGPRSINSLLTIIDSDTSQAETWSEGIAPAHGTLVANHTATSTGIPITPSGLSYAPSAGYVGLDSFTVTITDAAGDIDTTKIIVTVNPLPVAGVGTPAVCVGDVTVLTTSSTGGSWVSSNISIATVHASTGIITGIAAGTADIIYVLPTTCSAATTITVNPLPATITGTMAFCEGSTSPMSTASTGGMWASSNYAIAAIGTDGVITGVASGTAIITYRLLTGCIAATAVTVNSLPATITGASSVCEAATTTLSSATFAGSWTSSNIARATVGTSTGVVTGVAQGSVTLTYSLSTGCLRTHTLTVNPLPLVYNVTGGGSYCEGGAGTSVSLNNAEVGYTYNLYNGSSLMATHVSTGGAFSFGSMTMAGTYTATATTLPGCMKDMSSSATVVITPTVAVTVSLGTTPADTVCAGTLNTFTATPVNGGTTPAYAWTVNGTAVSATTDTFMYTPANGDVIAVTMTSSAVCPSPASVSAAHTMVVVSNETPVATVSAFLGSLPLSATDSICQGSTVNYQASNLFGGSAPAYTWYRNGVATGVTGASYTYIPVLGDSISVKLNSNYRCPITNNVSSAKFGLRIDSVYLPILLLSTNTGLSISAGTSVTFTGTVVNGGPVLTYQWYKNATMLPAATNNVYTTSALSNGDSISCWVTSIGNCAWYSFNAVKVKVANDVQVLATEPVIAMMPNPNSGEFQVNGTVEAGTDVVLQVTDVLGQIVYIRTVAASNGTLNESVSLSKSLANGMYMLNVYSGAERKTFRFMLKQ